MSTDDTRDRFRGLGIPDPRTLDATSLWEDESSYDQAGPTAGIPVAQQASELVLKARGDQPAGSSLRLRVQSGGYPGPTGATARWRREASSTWYGWDPPYVLTGYQHIATASDPGRQYPALLRLQSGDILQLGSRLVATSLVYDARRYDAATAAWQASVIVDSYTQPDLNAGHIDAVQLPDGRIVAFYLVEDTITSRVQVSSSMSSDDGATWSDWHQYALKGQSGELVSTTEFYRLRVGYLAATGEIALVYWYEGAGPNTHQAAQWASRDLGVSFEFVTEIDGDNTDDQTITGDVIAVDGTFQIWSCNPSTNAAVNGLESWTIGSAFDPIGAGGSGDSYATASFQISATKGKNRFAASVTDDGEVYLIVGNDDPAVPNLWAARRALGGCRGGEQNSGYGSIIQTGDAGVQPRNIAAVWHRNRAIMVSNHDSPATTIDEDALTALFFGGATDQPQGYTFFDSYSNALGRFDRSPEFVASWGRTYVPWELPGSDGWTRLASGTVTDQITGSDGLLNLLTTGTATIRYSENLTSMGDRARVWGVVTASTGQADVELRWDDGVSRREVQLTIPATGPAVVVNDPAGVATTIITHGEITDPVEFMMEIDESACKLWTRQWTASELRTWNTISSGAVTSSGAATGTGRVRFGALGATSDDVSWHAFAYSKGAQSGESLIDMTLPDDLRGFPIPSGPEEVLWIADGVWAWAVDGPASPGDEWLISTRYEYPIERIYPSVSPSPRLGWRSATATAGMEIAWREDTVSTAALGIRVLHLSGINFRQFQIQGRAGGMWLDLHTVENWIEFEYTRTGNTVKAGGAGLASSGEYLHHGEAVGGYLELSSTKVRKITHHTEGSLFQTGDRRQAQIVCDDMDDTEPTSGTARIWFPSVTVVMGPSGLEGWRIQIDDDASPVQSSDGYYQIGALFWGYVSYFATDYSFGRVKTIRPNTEITTARDGTRRSRVNGPPRRGVSFSFPAIDSTPFMAAGTPNNIETGPYGADHAVRDEPTRTDGIIEYIRGGDRPILYLPRIDKLELSPFGVDAGIHRARGTILGRVIGGVTMTSIAGDEETDEVLQIGTITIEEEV